MIQKIVTLIELYTFCQAIPYKGKLQLLPDQKVYTYNNVKEIIAIYEYVKINVIAKRNSTKTCS
jgi:hypothetical protein